MENNLTEGANWYDMKTTKEHMKVKLYTYQGDRPFAEYPAHKLLISKHTFAHSW